MKAIVMERFGAPDVLVQREVADPVVGPGDALIDVEFASVTFVETQIRAGRAPHASMLPELPVVPGNGVGGVVADVGSDLDTALLGARVVSTTGGSGGYAELAAVAAATVLPVPGELATDVAVALLADGRTAVGLIERSAIQAGETVLVEAAAGGVGALLVQLAKRAGARVVAAAGGERKLKTAEALGADILVDYRSPSWTAELAELLDGDRLDVVFDGVGGPIGRAGFELLGPGGRLCGFGMASGQFVSIAEDELRDRGVTLLRGAAPDPARMAALSAEAIRAAAAGELRPVIGQKLPLASAAEAHRAIEARATIGKTLLFP
ncbi:MAG: zinc-binding dehydrogenase [Solirubrobacteraceae bacterium]